LFTRLLFLFGQDGLAFANSVAVSTGFRGDVSRNLVSQQGRLFFLSGMKALWVSKKLFWMKLRNGSYRDYTPDYYPWVI
jgi:hypothetical protein